MSISLAEHAAKMSSKAAQMTALYAEMERLANNLGLPVDDSVLQRINREAIGSNLLDLLERSVRIIPFKPKNGRQRYSVAAGVEAKAFRTFDLFSMAVSAVVHGVPVIRRDTAVDMRCFDPAQTAEWRNAKPSAPEDRFQTRFSCVFAEVKLIDVIEFLLARIPVTNEVSRLIDEIVGLGERCKEESKLFDLQLDGCEISDSADEISEEFLVDTEDRLAQLLLRACGHINRAPLYEPIEQRVHALLGPNYYIDRIGYDSHGTFVIRACASLRETVSQIEVEGGFGLNQV